MLSTNVKAALDEYDFNVIHTVPHWALSRAAEITQAIVPQAPGTSDTRNMLYELPSSLKTRLTIEIAQALVETRNQESV